MKYLFYIPFFLVTNGFAEQTRPLANSTSKFHTLSDSTPSRKENTKTYLITLLIEQKLDPETNKTKEVVVLQKRQLEKDEKPDPNRMYARWDEKEDQGRGALVFSFTDSNGVFIRFRAGDETEPIGKLERVSHIPAKWVGNSKDIFFQYDYEKVKDDEGKWIRKNKWTIATGDIKTTVMLDFGKSDGPTKITEAKDGSPAFSTP